VKKKERTAPLFSSFLMEDPREVLASGRERELSVPKIVRLAHPDLFHPAQLL
jgi:hypothetical protein